MGNDVQGSAPCGRSSSSPVARRLPAPVAAGALVLVLLALTAFSVTSAVLTSRATGAATAGAALSGLYATAEEALVEQRATEAEVLHTPTPVLVAELRVQTGQVRADLLAIHAAGTALDRAVVDGLLDRHSAHLTRVSEVLDEVQRHPAGHGHGHEHPGLAGPGGGHLLESGMRGIEATLEREVAGHRDRTRETLTKLRRLQDLFLVLTPVVFGFGLLLLALFAAVLRDQRRQLDAQAEENRRQALRDDLTGLPNRALLRDRVGAALEQAHAGGGPLALLLIDLDRFKDINDTLGHHYGDVVLQAVAERLQDGLRAGDTVARLGGDEFAILLPDVGDLGAALDVAHRAREVMEAAIEADGILLDVDASIGVVLSGEHGDDVDTLIQRADIAMYVAKERGQGVCVYDAGLDDHSPERLSLLGELRRAIDCGELLLHFQPKVALPDDEVCGVEALLRWQHPTRGLLPPAAFIEVAERTPLIRPLTRWVVDAALAQVRQWQDAGRCLRVAVNVSARNLLDDGFVDEVLGLLQRWDVPASSLELEVTESAIMSDPDRAQLVLERFAALGFTLSIDDFGAGYTSLAHLKKLPVHQLKIDRSFVSQMSADRSDALIVRSVVELGRNLGLTTVAEGVEDRETWDQLVDLGCDVAQGYYLSRPLPAAALEEWFEAARRAVAA